MKIFSERLVCSYREPVFAWPLHSLTATWRAKKRHSISRFFKNLSLLLYRNIQSKKVNTALKTFPLLLNSHMRGLENDIELRFFRKVPLLSYRNIGGRKATLIFDNSQKIHKLVGFHGSKRKKSACLFSEADAHLVLFSFYFISRISSSFTSSVGLPPASSLFRKANIAAVNSRRSSARSTTTRSLLHRPNMIAPQQ